MDNKQMVESWKLSIHLLVGMGKSHLVQHMNSILVEECMIDMHLEVGMGRS